MKQVMNTREATQYLRITRTTIYKLIKAGKIKAARAGRDWRFLKRELDRFLQGGNDDRRI